MSPVRRVAALLALVAPLATAQLPVPEPVRTVVDSAAPERVDPASPRAALTGFLAATRERDHATAARWLDVAEVPPARAAELAQKLDAVLARHVLVDLDAVSGDASGDTTDLADPRFEFVGTIPGPDGTRDTIRLVRSRTRRDATAWHFPESVVRRVDTWYARLPNPWVRDRLPEPLRREGPLGVQWWQWLAILVLPFAAAAIGWLLARPLGILARRLVSRTASSWDDRVVDRLAGPVRLGIAATAAAPLVRLLGLPLDVEGTLLALARAAGLVALFWALLRATRLLERTLEAGHWGNTPQGRSLIPLMGRVLRAVLLVIGVLVALSQLGYAVGTVLAGLGLGGIAVALAAQKTIENLFGSFSLAADRAFRVGDWVSVDGTSGAVEQIGLRSTAIRTLGRSVVRIPNGKLADMRIENFGMRDRFVLDTTLALSYDTTMPQLRRILDGFDAVVRDHPHRWAEPGHTVRFTGFGESQLNVLVQAWFDTPDVNRFRVWQEEVLTALHGVVEREGASFAFPTRTIRVEEPGLARLAPARDGHPNPNGRGDAPQRPPATS
jgi:MscS family membrane protein